MNISTSTERYSLQKKALETITNNKNGLYNMIYFTYLTILNELTDRVLLLH